MSFRAHVSVLAMVLACSSAAMASSIKFGSALAPTSSQGRGQGWASIEVDLDTHSLLFRTGFTGMRGNSTAATLRGPTAEPVTGTADAMMGALTGFPLGVKSGTWEHLFDMTSASSYSPAFLASNGEDVSLALDSLLDALAGNKAYINIQTTQISGGELRGFFKVVPPVPEPASLAALFGLTIAFRRSR